MGTQVGGLWGGLCGWSVVRCGSAEATVGLSWGVALLRNPDAGMTCLFFFFFFFFFSGLRSWHSLIFHITERATVCNLPFVKESFFILKSILSSVAYAFGVIAKKSLPNPML